MSPLNLNPANSFTFEAGPEGNLPRTYIYTHNEWPMTPPFGDVVHLNEDAFYALVLQALEDAKTHHRPVRMSEMIPWGTDSEKDNVVYSILARINRDSPNTVSVWSSTNTKYTESPTSPFRTTTHPVKQPNGTYLYRSMDAIIGSMASGHLTSLETKGTVEEQKAFFLTVWQFQKDIVITRGRDLSAVKKNQPWIDEPGKKMDDLSAALENFAMTDTKPAAEEDDLAKAMDAMDVD